MLLQDLIKNEPLVKTIIDTMPKELQGRCRVKEVYPKELIYEKDEELRSVYIICSGSVRIQNQFDTGEVYDFAYMDSVNFLGTLEVLAQQHKLAAAVKAITKCVLIEISKEDFLDWMEKDHKFCILVAKSLAKKVYPTIYKNGVTFIYPAKYTVSDLLLKSAKDELLQKTNVVINKTRQQIADELSMNIRTVYRVLKGLKEDGLITIEQAKISISREQYQRLFKNIERFK